MRKNFNLYELSVCKIFFKMLILYLIYLHSFGLITNKVLY